MEIFRLLKMTFLYSFYILYCVYVAGVNKSLLRAMLYCVRAFRVSFSGSLKQLDYKVNSTGTQDNSTLVKQ